MDSLYIPIDISLRDYAPGYNISRYDEIDAANVNYKSQSSSMGPICWKCQGQGSVLVKQEVTVCKVCKGSTRLSVKKPFRNASLSRPGEITSVTRPVNWVADDFSTDVRSDDVQPKEGEQLCGLVGNWRIFQRYGGHRWTTDDIVTAWVAVKAQHYPSLIAQSLDHGSGDLNQYLDLGCGNGSVLLMTSKHLPETTQCTGIEARQDAVDLARRSIAYNCGASCERIKILNRDFRELYEPVEGSSPLAEGKYQLITGTPPYFRVNFRMEPTISKSSNNSNISVFNSSSNTGDLLSKEDCDEVPPSLSLSSSVSVRAIIRQGGMPTCKESAPARCEFRGGIEAYCTAAAARLDGNGVFVVCENWLNHDRVLRSVAEAGLKLCSVQRVRGKTGKDPLFCVYTSILSSTYEALKAWSVSAEESAIAVTVSALLVNEPTIQPDLVVRDGQGAWTLPYADMLREMSYPVASLHPSGRY